MLPAYVVAAFCKKLLRLGLAGPPSGALFVLALVSNLIRKDRLALGGSVLPGVEGPYGANHWVTDALTLGRRVAVSTASCSDGSRGCQR